MDTSQDTCTQKLKVLNLSNVQTRSLKRKKQMKIIRNCVNTLKSSDKKTSVVNVFLLTLIAQIDDFVIN